MPITFIEMDTHRGILRQLIERGFVRPRVVGIHGRNTIGILPEHIPKNFYDFEAPVVFIVV